MNPLPRVFLIRHGETEWSKAGRHTGRTDIALTSHGEEQALSVGRRIQALQFNRVFTSPLQRARATARLAGLGALLEIDPDLLEWDYGEYEGRRTDEIQSDRPGWNVFQDGCPKGESLRDVSARADQVVQRVRALTGNVALFAHAHVLRVVAARWLRLDALAARAFLLYPAGIGVMGYEHGNEDEPVVIRWNEACGEPL
jgi:broad specificity phosphatase PhoE